MADPLRWEESLATGFGALDEQHRALLECSNRLLACAASGPPWVDLERAFLELEVSFRAHAAEEEWMMRWLDYPRGDEHAGQHRSFLDQLDQLRASLDRDASTETIFLARCASLSAALLEHVAQEDRDLGAHAFGHALSG